MAPEPKPVLILLLTLAGCAGGALDAILYFGVFGGGHFTSGLSMEDVTICGAIGSGIGAAIGCALAISRRFWIRVSASAVFGYVGVILAEGIHEAAKGQGLPTLKDVLELDSFHFLLGAPAALVLTVTHDRFLAWRGRLAGWTFSPLVFGVLGAVSGTVFWIRHNDLLLGWVCGAVYGLAQLGGLFAAVAVDARMRRAGG